MLDTRHVARQLAGRAVPQRDAGAVKNNARENEGNPGQFRKILEQQAGLKFSKHAQKRLASRNISLTSSELSSIERAVDTARAKGARDSLVLLKDLAFVVSVKNNTVITAVNDDSIKENVFTNIDSAVIAR